MSTDDIIVGLDIGTTKIAAVVGKQDEYGNVKVLGVGYHPSNGLRRGVVINIEQTVDSIKKAVEHAELLSGHTIDEVYVGIAGDHIRSINSKGVISVKGEDKERSKAKNNDVITEEDVKRVIGAAQAIALPLDREIIHVLPQEYIVDSQDGIKNPVGMHGVRLEAEVHIVTAAAAAAKNIANCVVQAGCRIADIVLEPYASSMAVLDSDERDLGVCILDIGGGTTDIGMFFDGSIRFTSSVGLGGNHVTWDLSQGLRTSMPQAEEIKLQSGIAMESLLESEELVKVKGVGGRAARDISRSVIAAIIEPRMTEIFQLALRQMEKSNVLENMAAGVVLTGGASLLTGIAELAERVMGMPVKIGFPNISGGLAESAHNPAYATGVGLLHYALRHEKKNDDNDDEDHTSFKWILDRMKNMLHSMFGDEQN